LQKVIIERDTGILLSEELNTNGMAVAQVIRIMCPKLAINDHLVRWRRVAVSATIRRQARNFGQHAELPYESTFKLHKNF